MKSQNPDFPGLLFTLLAFLLLLVLEPLPSS